jgi:hypothetical protein
MTLNLNHGAAPIRSAQFDLSTQITAKIDEGLAAENAARPSRNYLGASELGNPCMRALVYQYRRAPKAAPQERMYRIWATGHTFEDQIIRWLRLAGFHVVDRASTGKQIRFEQAEGQIAGNIDGVVMGGPLILPFPMLLELKSLNNRSWQDLIKKGLAVSKEVYNAQVHLYMGYLDLEHCLFGAINKDTCELHWLIIPYDRVEAQRVSDRGVDVIRFGEDPNGPLPPRIASSRDYWLCRMCGYAEHHCWKEP